MQILNYNFKKKSCSWDIIALWNKVNAIFGRKKSFFLCLEISFNKTEGITFSEYLKTFHERQKIMSEKPYTLIVWNPHYGKNNYHHIPYNNEHISLIPLTYSCNKTRDEFLDIH